MKRLFYMMLICIPVIVLWGCTENGTEDEPTPPISYLEFSEETDISPEFEADGGTSLVEFTSSHDWTASANQSWISLSRKSGTTSNSNFTITVSENTSTSQRTGVVTITSNSKLYKVNISQQGKEEKKEIANNTIHYISNDNKVVTPYDSDAFGVNIVSNTYSNGQGVITFDGNVAIIGYRAFYGCSTLTEIELPNSINEVGVQAFFGCFRLKYFRGKFASNDNRCLIVDGDLKQLSPQISGDYSIPNTVTSLGRSSIYSLRNRCSITIPQSVTSLSDVCCTSTSNVEKFYGKFATANNLALVKDNILYGVAVYGQTSYVISDGVTTIMENVFQSCTKLQSITLPSSINNIGKIAFNSCTSLTTLYCKANTPPQIESNSNIFRDIETTPTIYVPQKSVDTYKSASGWSKYASYIKGYDFTDEPVESTFEFSSDTDTTPEFTAEGGTSKVAFTTSHDWTASTNQGWISLSRKSGTPSTSNFTVTVSENTSTSQRTGAATITSNGKSYEISISQKGKEEMVFEFSSDTDMSPEFESEGGTSKVSFTTSHDWTASANQSWISLSRKSGTTSNSNFTITVSENTSTSQRTGAVTITSNGKSYKINVSQKAYEEKDTSPTISFVDNVVKSLCIENWDKNNDGKLTQKEVSYITDIGAVFTGSRITSFNELVYFTNLVDIPYSAFEGCIALREITLPDIIKIDSYAFYGCSSLASIMIPDSVTSIGDHTFENCTGLTNTYIGKNVAKIGENAFSYCTGDLQVHCNIPDWTIYGNGYNSDNNPFYCHRFVNIVFGESVTRIGQGAFGSTAAIGDINYIESIYIPNSVTHIGQQAFYGCTGTLFLNCNTADEMGAGYGGLNNNNFSKIVISDVVDKIGDHTFYNSPKLQQVVVGKNVSYIGEHAFFSCKGELVLYCNIPDLKPYSGKYFYGSRFSKITIMSGVTSIGAYAFYGAIIQSSNIEQISVPNSVTHIGSYAFGSLNIGTIIIGDGVKSLGSNVFGGSTGKLIVNSNIPDNTGWYIGAGFSDVVIGDTVTYIGESAFGENNELRNVVIGDNVANIGKNAFYDCNKLSNIIIPNSVTSIGESAFEECNMLKSAHIGKGITSIGKRAFRFCGNLEKVYCNSIAPPSGADLMFSATSPTMIIYVPTASVSKYKAEKYWNAYADSIIGYDF